MHLFFIKGTECNKAFHEIEILKQQGCAVIGQINDPSGWNAPGTRWSIIVLANTV